LYPSLFCICTAEANFLNNLRRFILFLMYYFKYSERKQTVLHALILTNVGLTGFIRYHVRQSATSIVARIINAHHNLIGKQNSPIPVTPAPSFITVSGKSSWYNVPAVRDMLTAIAEPGNRVETQGMGLDLSLTVQPISSEWDRYVQHAPNYRFINIIRACIAQIWFITCDYADGSRWLNYYGPINVIGLSKNTKSWTLPHNTLEFQFLTSK